MASPLEVDSAGREGSHNDPLHYLIMGEVLGKPAVIADTLNCHHCISPDEQREWLQRLVHRHDAFETMLAALKRAEYELRDCAIAADAGRAVHKAMIQAADFAAAAIAKAAEA